MSNIPSKRVDLKSIIALGLTGGAVILEPISGVASLLARFAALGALWINDRQLRSVSDRVTSVEDRVTALEQLRIPLRKVDGDALRLFALCLERESTQLFAWVDDQEAMSTLSLSPQQYKEAAEDLRDFGLVTIDVNGNSVTGIARTRLVAASFIAAAPTLITDVDVSSEIGAVLDQLRTLTPELYRLWIPEALKKTGIPPARLDLILRGLEDLGFIQSQGPGSHEYGNSLTVELTSAGRRLLKATSSGAA
jgi:hypothetical protein